MIEKIERKRAVMGLNIQHWLLTVLAAALLILITVNIVFYSGNAQRQREINDRQALIKQAQQKEVAYRELIKDLSEVAVSREDNQLGALLVSQGIAVNMPQQAQGADASAPTEGRRHWRRRAVSHVPEKKNKAGGNSSPSDHHKAKR
jgi:hypothetical protein